MVGGKIVEKLEYIIEDSTIAEVLGVQNFTNEESAVLELVKNAYDAQAKKVTIVIAVDFMMTESAWIARRSLRHGCMWGKVIRTIW